MSSDLFIAVADLLLRNFEMGSRNWIGIKQLIMSPVKNKHKIKVAYWWVSQIRVAAHICLAQSHRRFLNIKWQSTDLTPFNFSVQLFLHGFVKLLSQIANNKGF